MAVGINNIQWLEKAGGELMPRDMKLDTFDVNWERRIVEDVRYTSYVGVPQNASAQSADIDVTTLTAASTTSFKFMATLPQIDKSLLGTGTITVEILASATLPLFPFSDAVQSKEITTSADNNSEGFQVIHDNTDTSLRYWALAVTTTMGVTGISDVPCVLDVVYNGNQRRKVKSLIGSLETNHRSTLSSQFDTFIDQATIANPVFYVADNRTNEDGSSRPMRKFTFTGDYKVDRITSDRGEGRTANVILAVTQEGNWLDE